MQLQKICDIVGIGLRLAAEIIERDEVFFLCVYNMFLHVCVMLYVLKQN